MIAFKDDEPYSEKNKKVVIQKLDYYFQKKNYFSDEVNELLQKNYNPRLGFVTSLPVPVSKHKYGEEMYDAEIFEVIPNDILAFQVNHGTLSGYYTVTYKVVGNDIIAVDVFPFSEYESGYIPNNEFDKKMERFMEKGYGFLIQQYDMVKNKNGEYIITTSFHSANDAVCCPSMMIEYKTKDFKNYIPLRIKNLEKDEWVVIE